VDFRLVFLTALALEICSQVSMTSFGPHRDVTLTHKMLNLKCA